MKLVILTSDIIDGRIVTQSLINAGRDIKAIVYEEKHKGFKTRIKLLLFFLLRRLKYFSYESMARNKNGILVKAVTNINAKENVELLKTINPDLVVVVGTRKLQREVFGTASKGAINLHSGLLPFYRGSDSEFWALYNNEPDKIGVTIHYIEEGLDTGDIILCERQKVVPNDTHSQLRKKNIVLGAKKINEVISLIESGKIPRAKQDVLYAKTYRSAKHEDIKRLNKRRKYWLKRSSRIKSFGNGSIRVQEEVARRPLVDFMAGQQTDYSNFFCLRIDADEFHDETFNDYIELFRKYSDAVTVFFNVHSFIHAKDKVMECKDMGLDIQSHGFYHYTYSDYASNRHSIRKAKVFFKDLGIETKGFASPMGRWNTNLMRALEDEGYEYSSDFAYDYLGLPSYPALGGRISEVLEIPVFPVAPELFSQKGACDTGAVLEFYKQAIDEMISCALPVIVYAHTSKFREVPGLLNNIVEYAVSEKGLSPLTMTAFSDLWRKRYAYRQDMYIESRHIKVPGDCFLGREASIGTVRKFKNSLKGVLDFEKLTPDEELCCPEPRKIFKRILRKVL